MRREVQRVPRARRVSGGHRLMQLSLLPREITPDTVLIALGSRVGAANGITASELALQIPGRQSAADERRLRQVIEQLRLDGVAICATPEAGSHLAAEALDR